MRQTLPDEYPLTLGSDPWQPIDLRPGEKVENYITPYIARIDRPGSDIDSIAEGFLPLAVEDDQGEERPVDLTLIPQGTSFVPKTPLIDLRVPSRLIDGVKLPGLGLGVRPQTSNPDALGSLVEGKLLYPNVQTDTDWAVASAPNGAQFLAYLRSAAAPEELRLLLDLPAGASLRLRDQNTPAGVSPSAVEVLRDGKVLATMQPPLATDALGEPVQTQYALDGNDVLIRVAHRDLDVAYPLEVDPIFDDFRNPQDFENSGWRYQSAPANYFISATNSSLYGRGLYVAAVPNGAYSSGQLGEWYYPAPGTSFIYRGEFGYVKHDVGCGTSCPASTVYEGIFAPYANPPNWHYGVWGEPAPYGSGSGSSPFLYSGRLHYNWKTHCVVADCSPHGSPGNRLRFGMVMSGRPGGGGATVFMGQSIAYLHDNDAPRIDSVGHSGLPGGWTKDANITTTVRASDTGLGLKTLIVSADDGATNLPVSSGCSGDRNFRCPNTSTFPFSYSAASGPEGIRTFRARAIDILGHEAQSAPWTLKVDRTKPTLDVGGSLARAFSDPRFRAVYEDDESLSVTATDGDGSRSQSGVVSVMVELQRPDGSVLASSSKDEACAAAQNCSLSPSAPLVVKTDDRADGDYRLVVRARDAAGNIAERTQAIVIDRSGDIYQSDLVTGQPGGQDVETLAREWGGVNATTARSQDEAQIQTRQPVPCDPQNAGAGTCDEVRTRLFVAESGASSDEDSFETYVGDGTSDPRLDAVATIARPSQRIEPDELKRTGPIGDALADWQAPPPAHGSQYAYYEHTRKVTVPADQSGTGQSEEVSIVHGLWVDEKTKMPIRATTAPIDSSGASDTVYWSYRLDRYERAELPAEHFGIAMPAQPGQNKTVTYTGAKPSGPLVDRETGMPFLAYSLGLEGTLGSLAVCLASNWTVVQDVVEPDDALGSPAEPNAVAPADEMADPVGIRTDVSSHYNFVSDLASCVAGRGSLDDPDLTVTSGYAQSTDALALRKAHGVGDSDPSDPETRTVTVDGQEVTAYIVQTGDGLSIYAQIGQTAVVVNGRIPAGIVPILFAALELM